MKTPITELIEYYELEKKTAESVVKNQNDYDKRIVHFANVNLLHFQNVIDKATELLEKERERNEIIVEAAEHSKLTFENILKQWNLTAKQKEDIEGNIFYLTQSLKTYKQ